MGSPPHEHHDHHSGDKAEEEERHPGLILLEEVSASLEIGVIQRIPAVGSGIAFGIGCIADGPTNGRRYGEDDPDDEQGKTSPDDECKGSSHSLTSA